MTNPNECQHHDMRPMPSMKANVCRRCGYYTPLEEDDEPPSPRLIFWIVVAFVLSVGAVVLLRAT